MTDRQKKSGKARIFGGLLLLKSARGVVFLGEQG